MLNEPRIGLIFRKRARQHNRPIVHGRLFLRRDDVQPLAGFPYGHSRAGVQAGGIRSRRLPFDATPGVATRRAMKYTGTTVSAPNILVDRLLVKSGTIPLGFVPQGNANAGVVDTAFSLGASFPTGTVLYFQAMSIFPGGEIRRTISIPVVVR